jgi:EAL domain-containing protein (putative c-di-GMP-specific phosphodiesterase class I)
MVDQATLGGGQKSWTTRAVGDDHRPGAEVNVTPSRPRVGGETRSAMVAGSESHPTVALKGRILVVDDELAMLRAYAKSLGASGYEVHTASDGIVAQERIRSCSFDAVLCDVAMPGVDGLSVLQAIRKHDLDTPVILVTGAPTEKAAANAVEGGALLYLSKPIELRVLAQVIDNAVRVGRATKLRREMAAASAPGDEARDRAGLEVRFRRAIATFRMMYQPIVRSPHRTVFAHAARMQSGEITLAHPAALFRAASRLGGLKPLGRAVRNVVASAMSKLPARAQMFIPIHGSDLRDDLLFSPDALLSQYASRVTLEITERASLDAVLNVPARIAALRAMGYRIALDDFGAGHGSLGSLVQIRPDAVKLDASLVRGLDQDVIKRKLVGAMLLVCREMKALVIAEGVETAEERDALQALGCEMLQGQLFAGPGLPVPEVT